MEFTTITTFEQACEARGYDPSKVLPDVTNMPARYQAAALATAKMYIVTEAINEPVKENAPWSPNWNNYDEKKWHPWFDMEKDEKANPSGFRFHDTYSDYDVTHTCTGSRLSFKTKSRVEHATKHFLPLYRDMLVVE